MVKNNKTPIKLFYSYSHKDEECKEELEKHLAILKRKNIISGWNDRKILAGSEWDKEIRKHLSESKIILLLISSDFIASDFCYNIETQNAIQRHESGDAYVIPIILKPTHWKLEGLEKLQALPKDGKAISIWKNQDEAWYDVVNGIIEICKKIEYDSEEDTKIATFNIESKDSTQIQELEKQEKILIEERDSIYDELKETENETSTIGKELFNQTVLKDGVIWLEENIILLSDRASKNVLDNFNNEDFEQFKFEIQKYLELIKGCLLTERSYLIDEPLIQPTFEIKYYIDAIKYIENRIPPHLSNNSISEIKIFLNYLIKRIL